MFLSAAMPVFGDELNLGYLISEALKSSPDIKAAESRAAASHYKIPQAKSLPDPMFMFGYQNEGFDKYTYGKSADAQWMFSLSQMFFYPGKQGLKGEIAADEAASVSANYHIARFRTIQRVTELYYDLFLAYKTIDLLKDKSTLFSQMEDAAAARYSSGMGTQQELIMVQTEKYMLLEREEIQKQRIQAIEGMLNAVLGRSITYPIGRPAESGSTPLGYSLDEFIGIAQENSHDVLSKKKMIDAAEARVKMARKEYYPDFTVNAGYFNRAGQLQDMWSLTTTINLPIFYKTRQAQAFHEAEASLTEAKSELEATKLMIGAIIRDSFTMAKTSEGLMDLYRKGLSPKAMQDVQAALSGYSTGKVETLTVISRLRALIDYETLYWEQFATREKAVSRLKTMAEIHEAGE
jgi:outer membrane protein, heavy metal efflux system